MGLGGGTTLSCQFWVILDGFDTTSCPGGVSFGTSPNGPNLPHQAASWQAHLTYLTPDPLTIVLRMCREVHYSTGRTKEKRETERQIDSLTDRQTETVRAR